MVQSVRRFVWLSSKVEQAEKQAPVWAGRLGKLQERIGGRFGRVEPRCRRAGYHPTRPAVIGSCGPRHISAAHLGGRPSGGRMGAMAGSPWRRGPDHSAGTASTAAATA
jgi:hypothetical protein